ncbi:MAG TPA: HEAT repeat domain-containing protein [Anaerolineales bacterium]|nr:HEAT repeat domain-containing protein [Anaerolineales bacterium]
MSAQIDELVRMRDAETLYELMTEDEDWLTQFDAAEGLVRLGDRRAFSFLMTAMLSDDEEILEVAQEIISSTDFSRMRAEIEGEQRRKSEERLQQAKKRLQEGGRVFRYKMVYIPSSALTQDDPLSEGYPVPALEMHGLEGWEIVNMLPSRRNSLVGSVDDHFTGAYFLLKKEVLAGDTNDLNK